MADNLSAIREAVRNSDLQRARELIRAEHQINPSAELFYWAAQVAITDEHKQRFMQKAKDLDPLFEPPLDDLEEDVFASHRPTPTTTRQSVYYDSDVERVQSSPVKNPFKGETLPFKFYFWKETGGVNFFSQNGEARENELVLNKASLPYDAIVDTDLNYDRLLIAFRPSTSLNEKFGKLTTGNSVLQLVKPTFAKVKMQDVKKFIDRVRSYSRVEESRLRLADEGNEHLFHTAICPVCKAMVNLSELDETRYIFCTFCESVFSQKNVTLTNGEKHSHCERCGMYSQPRRSLDFGLTFLIFAYRLTTRYYEVCDSCASRIFWRNFFSNIISANIMFPFVFPILLLPRLTTLHRRDSVFPMLDKANSLARKGQTKEASELYRQAHKIAPNHPGLLMNEGMTHLMVGNDSNASKFFEKALQSCANYLPVIQFVARLQSMSRNNG